MLQVWTSTWLHLFSARVGMGVTPRKDPAEAERTLPDSWDWMHTCAWQKTRLSCERVFFFLIFGLGSSTDLSFQRAWGKLLKDSCHYLLCVETYRWEPANAACSKTAGLDLTATPTPTSTFQTRGYSPVRCNRRCPQQKYAHIFQMVTVGGCQMWVKLTKWRAGQARYSRREDKVSSRTSELIWLRVLSLRAVFPSGAGAKSPLCCSDCVRVFPLSLLEALSSHVSRIIHPLSVGAYGWKCQRQVLLFITHPPNWTPTPLPPPGRLGFVFCSLLMALWKVTFPALEY